VPDRGYPPMKIKLDSEFLLLANLTTKSIKQTKTVEKSKMKIIFERFRLIRIFTVFFNDFNFSN